MSGVSFMMNNLVCDMILVLRNCIAFQATCKCTTVYKIALWDLLCIDQL